jgi:1-pyrroline-5-carboxylate dehydrogenase
MGKGFFQVPVAINEPVKKYEAGSPEREEVLRQYKAYYNGKEEIPLYIGSKEVKTGDTARIAPPHDHRHMVGEYHRAEEKHVRQAIDSALAARQSWASMKWEHRASVFLKAAALISGPYRARINAATMIAQSKNIHQAEIDSACELIDFLRFNVEYMTQIYNEQPESEEGIWNRVEYRPLEGFVYAVTPFNFTAIAGNLPTSAAMMGNVVVWKPSDHQVFSAKVIMDVLREAGLPPGVINLIYGDPAMITDTILGSRDFAGIHYTGSTEVFRSLWKKIGDNISNYRSYPRIVGETGGKDFILAHPSAKPRHVATAITRGAFEFQGQKCSAASRVYLPESTAEKILSMVQEDVNSFNPPGPPDDMGNFITAVIHEGAFDKLASYIDRARKDKDAEIVIGGGYDKSIGYFIEPTLIRTTDPGYTTMITELFGPVVTVYVYKDNEWDQVLELVDNTSEYALTGAVMAEDRYAIEQASKALENSAGNFYINDKPTGAVVGQQPFGGARASGTNDKAGSAQNLLRWVSPRLIKETFVSPEDYRYPFLD